MIKLTRLNGSEMFLNADIIATVESHHDTVVTTVDGKTYVVLERAEEVVAAFADYRAAIVALAGTLAETHERTGAEDAQVLVLRPTESDGG